MGPIELGDVKPKNNYLMAIAFSYFSPPPLAEAERRFLNGSGFFSPKAISASSSRREPVGVALRSFHARSEFSPFKFDFGAIHRSSADRSTDGVLREFFFFAGKETSSGKTRNGFLEFVPNLNPGGRGELVNYYSKLD